MTKITYLDLLTMVQEGRQPREIKFLYGRYTWIGNDYVTYNYTTEKEYSLSDTLSNWTATDHATVAIIEVIEEILTPAEISYLRAVIGPFRSKVVDVTKTWDYVAIEFENDIIALKSVEESDPFQFAGMEICKKYTLEELNI